MLFFVKYFSFWTRFYDVLCTRTHWVRGKCSIISRCLLSCNPHNGTEIKKARFPVEVCGLEALLLFGVLSLFLSNLARKKLFFCHSSGFPEIYSNFSPPRELFQSQLGSFSSPHAASLVSKLSQNTFRLLVKTHFSIFPLFFHVYSSAWIIFPLWIHHAEENGFVIS